VSSIKRRTLLKGGAFAVFGVGTGITLAACGNDGNGGTGGGGGGELDTSEAVTVTMLVLGDKPTNGRLEAMLTELNAKLTEKVNASLELYYIEWADWQTQYNVQLLSGDDNVDLIGTATDWLFAWENAEKGAFLPMDEAMLSSYAPKTWAQVDANGNWDLCKLDDGMIYFMPEDNYTQWTNHGFFYRGDWATEAGLPNGEITKFEDFGIYFQWVKDNQPEAYPWDVAGANESALTGYLQGHTDFQVIQQISAGNYYPFHTRESDPNTVTSWYMEGDDLLAAANEAKKWNEIGVWREDALNYDGDTREEFYAGLSGADQHHMQTFLGVLDRMKTDQPDADPKFFYWGKENNNYFRDIKTHGAMAVSANSSNPERALAVYDLLRNDEECYNLLNFGIEGTDYVINDEGQLAYPEGYDPATDSLGANFWYGRMDEFEPPRVSDPPNKQEMFDALDANAKDYPYSTLLVNKDMIDPTLAAMGAVLSEYIPQLQYGKFDDPASAIEEMRGKLRDAGYDDALTSIQTDLDGWSQNQG
jgi:putative aldouronate transport system substrate-binding protein